MKVAREPGELERTPRAVAIGTFDGVHLGHRSVVRTAIEAGPLPTVHGDAGNRVNRRHGRLGFLARELPDEIPALMAEVRRSCSTRRRIGRPGPTRCCWPTMSSSVRGRRRAASGAWARSRSSAAALNRSSTTVSTIQSATAGQDGEVHRLGTEPADRQARTVGRERRQHRVQP